MAASIVIRGAGPVGCALALLLRARGCEAVLRSRGPTAGRVRTFRPIALSHASRLILGEAGAWQGLRTSAIHTVEVSQAGGFGRTRMTAADAGVPALGHVIEYGALAAALARAAQAAGIEIRDESEPAPQEGVALTVHAEGISSDAAEKRYVQDALVALVETAPCSAHTAFERFTPGGPLALLPFDGRYGLVWATREAHALAEACDETFLSRLSSAFGGRAGRFVCASHRAVFPLALRVRASRIGRREAYVGNAAQTLHPVAGQGLNLGLRDAWELAAAAGEAPDPGDARVLARYSARRRLDAFATTRVTDALASLFLGASPLAGAARGIALTALDACAPARRFFARRMIFGASALP
jgi:2-octaprenyl-6-methoxyphenol hydroxylase